MAIDRKCPECGTGNSANRAGKPGKCVACIDSCYRRLRVEPLDAYTSPKVPRLYSCIDCNSIGKAAFADIRTRAIRLCESCICREMYEAGIASDPARWDVNSEQAAQIILDHFVARGDEGEPLDAIGLAARMTHVWVPVDVECLVCGTPESWSISKTLGSSGDPHGPRCQRCFSLPLAAWQDRLFEAFGLVRDHDGYARLSDPVAAHCANAECGAERRISVTDLTRGVAPCLNCAELADPDALHVVYKVHFPSLGAFKVGITNTEVRQDRIASHLAHGGVLLECHQVPNKEAARAVEESVLCAVRDFPSSCTPQDLPQGGYTETWSDTGPDIDLGHVVATLTREEAPGFDRLKKLREYFATEPATVEEIVKFRQITVEEVDGIQVHSIGLSEPLEQVLRKIRAER